MNLQRFLPAVLAIGVCLLLSTPVAHTATYPATTTPDGRQRTSSLTENPPVGRAFYEPNAAGPVTIRENHTVDSTITIETKGARRIRVWIYLQALADTTTGAAIQDSANITWVGIRPKAHINSQPDSGVAARVVQVRGYGTFHGSSAIVADTTGMRWTAAGAAQNSWARDVWNTPMAGEFMVPISRPTQATTTQGTGQPAWVAVDLCVPDVGCFTGTTISVFYRVFGHSTTWPAAGGQFSIIKNPTRRYSARIDVEGLL